MNIDANTHLLQQVMGFETKSTHLFIEAVTKLAANCNIKFNKTKPDYIDIQEKLDIYYAKCINDCEVKINATGALYMDKEPSSLTVGEKLDKVYAEIQKLTDNPFVNSRVELRNALDTAYAIEDYLFNKPPSDLCNHDDLNDLALAVKYYLDFDGTDPDFEKMRQQILDCEMMISWLNKRLVDTDDLSYSTIAKLYNGYDEDGGSNYYCASPVARMGY